jgi:hypothetical protein
MIFKCLRFTLDRDLASKENSRAMVQKWYSSGSDAWQVATLAVMIIKKWQHRRKEGK